jgi:hypothetical protein
MLDNKIIIRVFGGLGNQLFIYTFARYLSLKSGIPVFLEKRTGFVKDNYRRRYRLDAFNIELNTCPWYLSMYYPSRSRLAEINRFVYRNSIYMTEDEFSTDPEMAILKIKKTGRVFLDGYWQNRLYSSEYDIKLRNELTPRISITKMNQIVGTEMNRCNSVAIHFRRINYKSLLDQDYYTDAISRIKSRINDPVFYIFSDDIEWCRKNFRTGDSLVYIDHNGNDEIGELWLMSQCRHFIIANSTFSWWGAWLSVNADKIIIKPAEFNI